MTTIVGNENLRDLWNELSASRGDHLFLTCEDRAGHRRSFTYGESVVIMPLMTWATHVLQWRKQREAKL